MNTHDKYELPPLPYSELGGVQPNSHVSRAMEKWGRVAIEADRKHTDELIARYQEKIRSLEAENYALISESDNRQANNLEPLTPAEAVFAFAGWLTGRSDPVTLSSRHGAAIAVDLAVAFNESQGLHRFREDFHKHIKPYPAEKDQQARSEPTDNAGYTLGPVSDGGFDPRDRGEPAFYVNARIFDPATGKIKTDVNGALTWSEKPAGNWQVPVYTTPQPQQQEGEPTSVRKAFVCTACEGVYADQPVSQCDCMPEKDEFIEGTITYPSPAAPQPQQQASEPKGTVYWLNASPTVAWVGRPPDEGEHIYTTPQPQQITDGLSPIETIEYWRDAYAKPNGDQHFMGHGMVAELLKEYAQLRAMLEAAPQPTTEKL